MSAKPLLRYDATMMGRDWRPFEGQKVRVKFRNGRRFRFTGGTLRIIDYPFACSCCGCTTAVLTDNDGNVTWSGINEVVRVGENVTSLVALQPQLRAKNGA